jgi:hypothetical protein
MRQVDNISLVPRNTETVHLVVDDFGTLGRSYRETDEQAADATTVVENLLSGQYFNPLRVIAFNLEEGWVRDASEEMARSLLERGQEGGQAPARRRPALCRSPCGATGLLVTEIPSRDAPAGHQVAAKSTPSWNQPREPKVSPAWRRRAESGKSRS